MTDADALVRAVRVLDRKLSRVRQAQNSLRPINQLPPEILVSILQFAAERDRSLEPHESERAARFTADRIARVCKHIRDVALSTRNLWAVLPMQNSSIAARNHARAGGRGLVLVLYDPLPLPVFAHLPPLIKSLKHDVREIEVSVGREGDGGFHLLDRVRSDDFPQLRVLSVYLEWYEDERDIIDRLVVDAIRHGDPLRLALHSCHWFDFRCLPPRLTHLTLEDSFGIQSLEEDMVVLESISSLETLSICLTDNFAGDEGWTIGEQQKKLRALRELRIQAPWCICAAILSHVELPPRCALDTMAHRSGDDDRHIGHFLDALYRTLDRQPPVCVIEISESRDFESCFYGADGLKTMFHRRPSGPDTLTIWVQILGYRPSWQPALYSLLSQGILAGSVRSVSFVGPFKSAIETAPFVDSSSVQFVVRQHQEMQECEVPELHLALELQPGYFKASRMIIRDLCVNEGKSCDQRCRLVRR